VTVAAYARPTTIEEAIRELVAADGEAHLLAGGTSLTLLRRQGFLGDGPVVDLGRVAGLDRIEPAPGGGLAIGATATLRAIETSALVRERAPVLAETIGRVATVRIRNQATLGGNLAHADPAQDPPPILLVLDAEAEVAGVTGTRRVSLDGFFVDVFETILGPTDILVRIHVPSLPPGSRIGYEKFLPRTADDYATVSVAARLDVAADRTVAGARLALGSVAATPVRVPAAEALLEGARLADLPVEAVVAAVLDAIDPIGDVRGSVEYKRAMAAVWTGRLLRRLARADGPANASSEATGQ
jgi:carbon-monoxide dehydrogenase medium subunit